ncbi:MAG: signal peptidase I [Stackebrandtia sp.]
MLLVIAVAVALLVRTFILQSFWIPSGSMENTLQLDDYVLANKVIYDFRDPERGEIVVFKAPSGWGSMDGDEDFIKRVIAVGGDTVSYDADEGKISVNGEPIDETSYLYTDPQTGEMQSPSKDDEEFEVVVPEGRLWVMGDHRWASGDSRERYVRTGDPTESTVPVDEVVGKAFVLVWPADRWDWMTIPDTFDDVPEPE